jgi:AraC-like DNA-binding protein
MSLLQFSFKQLSQEDLEPFLDLYSSVTRADLSVPDGKPFRAALSVRLLPNLNIALVSCSPCLGTRSASQVTDGDDDFVLCIPVSGRLTYQQKNREVSLIGYGGAYLWANEVPGGCTVHSPASALGIAIPNSVLRSSVSDLDRALKGSLPPTPELVLLAHYASMLTQDMGPLSPALKASAASHVHDLVAMVLGARSDAAAIARIRGLRAARFHAIQSDIIANLTHPDLSIAWIAARQHITPRYVRALFESEGTSFTEFVLRQRLSRAHRLLTDPRHMGSKILTIAYNCGFNNLSYFNRCFRRYYGMTPSEVRAAAHQAICPEPE